MKKTKKKVSPYPVGLKYPEAKVGEFEGDPTAIHEDDLI